MKNLLPPLPPRAPRRPRTIAPTSPPPAPVGPAPLAPVPGRPTPTRTIVRPEGVAPVVAGPRGPQPFGPKKGPSTFKFQRFLVGVFDVPGVGRAVAETPLTSDPKNTLAALNLSIAKKYPGVIGIRRLSSSVECRDPGESVFIDLPYGATLRNIFPEKSPFEVSRKVGRVWFQGEPCDLSLRFIRAKSTVTVALVQLNGRIPIAFSNQIQVTQPATSLPDIIKGVLGKDMRNLDLFIRVQAGKTLRPRGKAKQ